MTICSVGKFYVWFLVFSFWQWFWVDFKHAIVFSLFLLSPRLKLLHPGEKTKQRDADQSTVNSIFEYDVCIARLDTVYVQWKFLESLGYCWAALNDKGLENVGLSIAVLLWEKLKSCCSCWVLLYCWVLSSWDNRVYYFSRGRAFAKVSKPPLLQQKLSSFCFIFSLAKIDDVFSLIPFECLWLWNLTAFCLLDSELISVNL